MKEKDRRSIGKVKTFGRWRRFDSSISLERDEIAFLFLCLSLSRALSFVYSSAAAETTEWEGFGCKYSSFKS